MVTALFQIKKKNTKMCLLAVGVDCSRRSKFFASNPSHVNIGPAPGWLLRGGRVCSRRALLAGGADCSRCAMFSGPATQGGKILYGEGSASHKPIVPEYLFQPSGWRTSILGPAVRWSHVNIGSSPRLAPSQRASLLTPYNVSCHQTHRT